CPRGTNAGRRGKGGKPRTESRCKFVCHFPGDLGMVPDPRSLDALAAFRPSRMDAVMARCNSLSRWLLLLGCTATCCGCAGPPHGRVAARSGVPVAAPPLQIAGPPVLARRVQVAESIPATPPLVTAPSLPVTPPLVARRR